MAVTSNIPGRVGPGLGYGCDYTWEGYSVTSNRPGLGEVVH